jgi:GT2 family glycosyltransferase
MLPSPLVYIILLNYRGAQHTLACLDSLRQLDYPNYKIVVIDNASPDDSATILRARQTKNPGEFHFIQSTENLGYSGGNNLGIIHALANANAKAIADSNAYIWLLNNDTTVDAHALTALVQEAHKTRGLVGSLLLYPDGNYQQVGTRLNWWTGGAKGYRETDVQDSMPVETLSGASMLIPFPVLRRVGLLDPSFFLYFEDGEFSLRCRRAMVSLTVTPGSKVYHEEGATTGRKSLLTQYYFHRNRLRLLFMFANPPQKVSIGLYTAFRMLRSIVKSRVPYERERVISANIQMLALRDFRQGIQGKCPHNLEKLT